MFSSKLKIYSAIGIHLFILFIISIGISFSSIKTSYYTYGPNNNLLLFGMKINTIERYIYLQLFIFLSEITDVLIKEITMPQIDFTIYNPDKKIIIEFNRFELQCFANLLYTLDSIKKLFLLMITISQFDIALSKVLYCGLTRIYTIYFILSEKKFNHDSIV